MRVRQEGSESESVKFSMATFQAKTLRVRNPSQQISSTLQYSHGRVMYFCHTRKLHPTLLHRPPGSN
jgi:hypothetical protein